jgi:hypothetical protein
MSDTPSKPPGTHEQIAKATAEIVELAKYLRQPPGPAAIPLEATALDQLRLTRSAIESLLPVLEALVKRLQAPEVAAIEAATQRAVQAALVISAASDLWEPLTTRLDAIEQRQALLQARRPWAAHLALAFAVLTLCAGSWTLWRASSMGVDSQRIIAQQLEWQQDTTARLTRLEARPAPPPTSAPPTRSRP